MKKKQYRAALLAWFSVALVVSACQGQDASRSLSAAKDHLQKKESKAAVIELKNALQAQPDLAEARFLLGKAYLESGEFANASSELRRARDLKYPDDSVVPSLAKAMLGEQQAQQVIDQFATTRLNDKAATADLQSSLASAYLVKNDSAKAQAALATALAAVPGYPLAVRIKAVALAQAGQFDQAIQTLQPLLESSSKNADAWHTKGEFLLYGKHDAPAAILAFRQAMALSPGDVNVRTSLITTLLSVQDLTAASAEVEALRKTSPRQPQTVYFDAQIAYSRQDYKRAHELTDQLTRLLPDNVQVRQLAGAVELKLGLLLEAERSLTRALQLTPNLPTSRKLLAQTYLRLGQPAKSLESLAPLLTESSKDPEAVSIAAEANLRLGNFSQASENIAKAAALNPADVQSRVALALSKSRKGHEADTVAELRAIAAADKGTYADLVLASMFLKNKDFDRALKAVDAVESKQPGQALTANIRGRIYLMQNDVPRARSNLERALSIDPTFVPAAATLASLDLADKQADKARQRFEAVLKADPKNLDALMALAGMRAKAGASPDEIEGLMQTAIRLNPTAAPPRLLLVDSQFQRNKFKEALATAQEAVNALPGSIAALDALGRAQLAVGDANQAISTFSKMAALDANSPAAYFRLANVRLTQHDSDGAIQEYKKALAIDPESFEAQRALVNIYTAAGRPEEALLVARNVEKQHPDEPAGYLLEGGIESGRNRPAAAAEVYRAALKRAPVSPVATRLYAALVSAGRLGEAEQFAASWTAGHPNDAVFIFATAEAALNRRENAVAEARFKEVLKIAPDNAPALNNMAWLMAQSGKAGAVGYARQATTLVPGYPTFWDTLAVALAAEHKPVEAVEAQKKAVDLAPTTSKFRLALARLYVEAGDKAKARAELDKVLQSKDKAEFEAQANELARKL